MFFASLLHVEGWTVKVKVKDAKIPKPFIGCNSAAYGPIYFKYRTH